MTPPHTTTTSTTSSLSTVGLSNRKIKNKKKYRWYAICMCFIIIVSFFAYLFDTKYKKYI